MGDLTGLLYSRWETIADDAPEKQEKRQPNLQFRLPSSELNYLKLLIVAVKAHSAGTIAVAQQFGNICTVVYIVTGCTFHLVSSGAVEDKQCVVGLRLRQSVKAALRVKGTIIGKADRVIIRQIGGQVGRASRQQSSSAGAADVAVECHGAVMAAEAGKADAIDGVVDHVVGGAVGGRVLGPCGGASGM